MNILVIGSGGMLGHTTTLYLRSIGHQVTDISRANKLDERTLLMDVTECGALSRSFLTRFDAVINCAALLVQPCKTRPHDAVLLNSWFPHMLEAALKDTSVKIVQVSTDGVFHGDCAPCSENDIPDAQTFYGRSKLLGELDNGKDITVRASFVGPDLKPQGTGLLHWFVSQKERVKGYRNVRFNAVTSLEFVKFVVHALGNNFSGIYHLGASESISKAEFLHKVKERFQLDIEIEDDDHVNTNHTLHTVRDYHGYEPKTYQVMLDELKSWMQKNKHLYPHYHFL